MINDNSFLLTVYLNRNVLYLLFFLSGSGKNTLLEELKNNERENLRLIAEKVKVVVNS